MPKFYGLVGFADESVEESSGSGVYKDVIEVFYYYGDILRNTRKMVEGESVNDDLTVNNTISIVADAYAREHFHAIRYVSWSGALWKVTDVEVQSPRLLLRLGGVYNGPTPV